METAHLAKNQILQQAATAMLGANEGQQGLLQLIQWGIGDTKLGLGGVLLPPETKGTEMANIGATTAFYKVRHLTRANNEVSKSMERLATGKANANAGIDLPMMADTFDGLVEQRQD